MSQFIGLSVSLDCGDTLGIYQGIVASVDNITQSISIEHAFQNGIRCNMPLVTINAHDIKDISVIENIAKPKDEVHKLAVVNSMTKLSPSLDKQNLNQSPQPKAATGYESPGKLKWNSNSWHAIENDGKQGKSTPPHKTNGRHRSSKKEDCFGAPIESFDGEFDFEKNLALFDKQAVFEEIDSRKNWNNVRSASDRQAKFRCDENVLPGAPVALSQIKMNGDDGTKTNSAATVNTVVSEYVTDSGLVVPTVTSEIRNKLLSLAAAKGITFERQIEAAGRSAAEVAVQLLGGGHRLTPKNAHQLPMVVVLCSSYTEGAIAVNCARHLALRNVKVVLYICTATMATREFETELQLFSLTEQRVTYNLKDLPDGPVDLVIDALDNHSTTTHLPANVNIYVAAWLGKNRANLMAIDPPAGGPTVGTAKCSLSLALPLSLGERCGQVLLCDVALPKCVFRDLGIQYSSPFAHKFVIPLYPRRQQ